MRDEHYHAKTLFAGSTASWIVISPTEANCEAAAGRSPMAKWEQTLW